jgi:type IV secretion system protein VirD4
MQAAIKVSYDVLDIFGREWRRIVAFFVLYTLFAGMVVLLFDGLSVGEGVWVFDVRVVFAVAGGPLIAAALSLGALTDERWKLGAVALLMYAVGVYAHVFPVVSRLVASRFSNDVDMIPVLIGVVGFLATGGIFRAIYEGDEKFTRPWTQALGDARWMTMAEARDLLPAGGDVVIGEAYIPFKERKGTTEFKPNDRSTWGSGGRAPLLCYDMSFDSTHMLFFAGSGGYKTTSTVIPTARRYGGSMVVLDPALEIGQQVGPVRERLKGASGKPRKVVMIEPEGEVVRGCDVLELLRQSKRQELDVGAYANMLLTEKPKATSGSDAFFEGNNYGLMTGLLMYVLHGRTIDYEEVDVHPATLRQLRTLTSMPEAKLKELIGHIHLNNGVPGPGYIKDPDARRFIKQSLAPFVTMAQESWTGIAAQVGTDTKWLSVKALADAACTPTFSLKDMPEGDTDVFLQIRGEVIKSNPGVIRVIVGAIFQAMMTQERAKGAKPVLFVLDEVDLLGYMSALEEARDRGRKFGISLMLLYQSVGQIEKHFSKESATAWFDSAAIVSYAAIKSPETSDRLSKLCGELTVEVDGYSKQGTWRDGAIPSLSNQARNTSSISLQKRPLILPHEVREMRSDEQIVFVRGKPALRCGRAIFFRRPEMLEGLGVSKLREGRSEKGPTVAVELLANNRSGTRGSDVFIPKSVLEIRDDEVLDGEPPGDDDDFSSGSDTREVAEAVATSGGVAATDIAPAPEPVAEATVVTVDVISDVVAEQSASAIVAEQAGDVVEQAVQVGPVTSPAQQSFAALVARRRR